MHLHGEEPESCSRGKSRSWIKRRILRLAVLYLLQDRKADICFPDKRSWLYRSLSGRYLVSLLRNKPLMTDSRRQSPESKHLSKYTSSQSHSYSRRHSCIPAILRHAELSINASGYLIGLDEPGQAARHHSGLGTTSMEITYHRRTTSSSGYTNIEIFRDGRWCTHSDTSF